MDPESRNILDFEMKLEPQPEPEPEPGPEPESISTSDFDNASDFVNMDPPKSELADFFQNWSESIDTSELDMDPESNQKSEPELIITPDFDMEPEPESESMCTSDFDNNMDPKPESQSVLADFFQSWSESMSTSDCEMKPESESMSTSDFDNNMNLEPESETMSISDSIDESKSISRSEFVRRHPGRRVVYQIKVEGLPEQIMQKNRLMLQYRKLADVVLICGERLLKLHKLILAANSPMLRDQFRKDRTIQQLILTNCSYCILRNVLELIYCGRTQVLFHQRKSLASLIHVFDLKHMRPFAVIDPNDPTEEEPLPSLEFSSIPSKMVEYGKRKSHWAYIRHGRPIKPTKPVRMYVPEPEPEPAPAPEPEPEPEKPKPTKVDIALQREVEASRSVVARLRNVILRQETIKLDNEIIAKENRKLQQENLENAMFLPVEEGSKGIPTTSFSDLLEASFQQMQAENTIIPPPLQYSDMQPGSAIMAPPLQYNDMQSGSAIMAPPLQYNDMQSGSAIMAPPLQYSDMQSGSAIIAPPLQYSDMQSGSAIIAPPLQYSDMQSGSAIIAPPLPYNQMQPGNANLALGPQNNLLPMIPGKTIGFPENNQMQERPIPFTMPQDSELAQATAQLDQLNQSDNLDILDQIDPLNQIEELLAVNPSVSDFQFDPEDVFENLLNSILEDDLANSDSTVPK